MNIPKKKQFRLYNNQKIFLSGFGCQSQQQVCDSWWVVTLRREKQHLVVTRCSTPCVPFMFLMLLLLIKHHLYSPNLATCVQHLVFLSSYSCSCYLLSTIFIHQIWQHVDNTCLVANSFFVAKLQFMKGVHVCAQQHSNIAQRSNMQKYVFFEFQI